MSGETLALAQRIKRNVRIATGLSCSIGITPNKLLSKIASDLEKPDGLTVLSPADIPSRIWPLPCRKINGIGPRSSAKLAGLGLHTIGELALAPVDLLIVQFGNHYGRWLSEVADGRDDRPVATEQKPKSISRETTFERDLDPKRDREFLSQILLNLCVRLGADLQRKGYRGKTIGLKLRYANFQTINRDTTLDHPIDDPQLIRNAVRSCLRRTPLNARLRLLGVRASALVSNEEAETLKADMTSAIESRGRSLPLFD